MDKRTLRWSLCDAVKPRAQLNACHSLSDSSLRGEGWCLTLTSGRCSAAPNSMETALARRDWAEAMVGVAAVWVMAGRGGGAGGGMEAFGFSIPLGLSIMAWIFISAGT